MANPSNVVRPPAARGSGTRFLSGGYTRPGAGSAVEPPRSAPCPEDPTRHTYPLAMAVQSDLEAHQELRAIPALAELPRDTLGELGATASQRRVHSGVTLVEQGVAASHLELLVRGAVKVVRTTRHAMGESTVVLEVARAPAILCGASLFDGHPEPASIVTLRSSHVIALERRVVLRVAAQHPAFARALLGHMAQAVRRHVRRIDEVASGPVDDRVRHLLEGLAHEHGTPFGQGRFIAIPLRRKDIACMVNATTETVSRVLARFEREGLTRSTRDGIWLRVAGASGKGGQSEGEPSEAPGAPSRSAR